MSKEMIKELKKVNDDELLLLYILCALLPTMIKNIDNHLLLISELCYRDLLK